MGVTKSNSEFSDEETRFIVHQVGDAFSTQFYIESMQNEYLSESGKFVNSMNQASVFTIEYIGDDIYTIKSSAQKYWTLTSSSLYAGLVETLESFEIFSVTY